MLLTAQELPPVINYLPADYNAGNQNWMITQSSNEFIYVANNKGLLEFNGAQWKLYPTQNESIMRSVKSIDDRVYSGCYMDFGYWQRDAYGAMQYSSIVQNLNVEVKEDEQFWNIIDGDSFVLFQSLSSIYSYNKISQEVVQIVSQPDITKLFRVEDHYYYQVIGQGLFEIVAGKPVLVNESPLIKETSIISMFQYQNKPHFLTVQNDLYILDDNKLLLKIENTIKENISVYSASLLSDGTLMIGTISNGIFNQTIDGKVLYQMDQSDGILNNTSLFTFEDINKNVWIGLDNGVSCLNVDSPYKLFVDQNGTLGTVYTSLFKDGFLYLGTNQGLFVKSNDQQGFKFITGTEGQVWKLKSIGDTIFCGHNSGTFLIENDKATLIAKVPGSWDFQSIVDNELILQGNYSGLYYLHKVNGKWGIRSKLDGFEMSSKDFALIENEIYVNHEYKGVYQLSLTDDLFSIKDIKQIEKLGKGIGSDLVVFNEQLLFAKRDGIYVKSKSNSDFAISEQLSVILKEDDYSSGTMVKTNDNSLWVFTERLVHKISKDNINDGFIIKKIYLSKEMRNEKIGYENVSIVNDDQYLIGSSTGYLLFNEDYEFALDHSVFIDKVYDVNASTYLNLQSSEPIELKPKNNDLKISFNSPVFKGLGHVEYQHRFSNDSDLWSPLTKATAIDLSNLNYGSYKFEVRSSFNNQISNNVAAFDFIIEKPFYATNLAIVCYVLLGILALLAINYYYKWHYRKEEEKALAQQQKELELKNLANQKDLIQLRNEQLNKDIEHRNNELAISTMAMIKKNETLNEIKAELEKVKDATQVKSAKRLVEKNLSSKQDWITFEEAFNNADKDFFKRVKDKHPNLTTGDLRLCVYLRLNLSSKEIAPLLNISPRSVEIKRYRLRKKIDMTAEMDLNEYFINF